MSQHVISCENFDQKLDFSASIDGQETTKEAIATLNPKFHIMLLPFTVREQILQHLRPVKIIRVFLPGFNGPRPTPIQLPITAHAGDKTLRLETIRTTLLNSQLEIHSGPANRQLQQWLASLDFSAISTNLQDGFDVVRKLSFPYFSRFPHHLPQITSNQDINLMKKCRHLKQVCIHFVAEEVVRSGVEKTADQLVREYYLDQMLGLDELEILEFSGHCTQDTEVGVYATALWFKRQFDQREDQDLRSKEVKVVLPRGLVVELHASATLKNE